MWRALILTAVGAPAAITSSVSADGNFFHWFDVSGWSDRTGMEADLGGGDPVVVSGVVWDVTLTASNGAWLSDGWFALGSPEELPQIFLIPGINDSFGGTQNYSGAAKFEDLGLPNVILPNGFVLLQFLTSGWDVVVDPGSVIGLQFDIVPAPGALAVLAMATVVATTRRRSRG